VAARRGRNHASASAASFSVAEILFRDFNTAACQFSAKIDVRGCHPRQ
jgi:hypothetical protein